VNPPRLVLSALAAVPLAIGALVALPAPAQALDTDVKVNEVSSQGGIPGDWIELVNLGNTPVDLSNYVLKDSNNGNIFTIPNGTTIAANGYYAADVDSAFGLGNGDDARFFKPDGTTLIDGVTFANHATKTTWSRCPEGTGPLVDTEVGTKGLPNACAPATAWPGGAAVTPVASGGGLSAGTGDVSGLAYEGSGTSVPGTMWVVDNGLGRLYRVANSGGTWAPTANWDLNYPGGTGTPDSEGVTITDAGSAGGVYVATERDGAGASRPAILRFTPTGAGGALNATNDWNLTADLPGLGANEGPEAVAWVPDSYLTSKGFKKDGGATYNPADFPNHGSGLFFVGIEQTGEIIGYALNHATNGFTRVSTTSRVMSSVMDLVYDPERQVLWAECDNNCGGRAVTLDVTGGFFTPTATYERPTGQVSNLNNEGFTIASRTECVGGVKPVFWVDDDSVTGNPLSTGTINCTPGTGPTISGAASSSKAKTAAGWYSAPVTVTFSCTAGSSPLSGGCPTPVTLSTSGANQSVSRTVHNGDFAAATATVSGVNIDLVKPTAKITGVKKGKTYASKKKPKCKASDALSGLDSCKVKQKKKGSKYTVTATATDKAGNVTVVKLTYSVKKK
jgi:lamin tail-like protein